MSSALHRLADLLDSGPFREKMVRTALKVNEPDPRRPHKRAYSEPEVRQMHEGFTSLILEDLRQNGTRMRTLFLDTLMPGFVAQGLSLASIVKWNVSFMVLVSCEAIAALAPEDRDEAQHWLADFSGIYIGEMAEAVVQTAQEAKG